MSDQSFTPDERDVAMRKAISDAEAECLYAYPTDEGGYEVKPGFEKIAELLGVIRQNFHANPPLVPAGSWRAARVRVQDMPRMSDSTDVAVILEIHPHIFRKQYRVSGGATGPEAMFVTGLTMRCEEILKDALYWLAGEVKPQ